MPEITIKSLIKDYMRDKMADEVAGDWGTVAVYRPLALILTWPLAYAGIPPTVITIAALLLIPVIFTVAVTTAPTTAVPSVCILGALFCVLDCIDGSLARALKRESKFGYYFDLSVDMLYRLAIYASLGLLADRISGSPHATSLVLALVAAWLALFARIARLYKDRLLPPVTTPPVVREDRSLPNKIHSILSGLDTLLPLLALAFWWSGELPLLFIWLLIYSAADAIYSQIATMRALRGL